MYVKAGLEKDKSALLVAIGGLSNGQKVVLAVEPGHRESSEGWSGVLRDLKERGMNRPRMVAGDGNLGIWGALSNVYPGVLEQRCWNHKIMNVLDKLPKKAQAQGKLGLQRIFSAESQKDAEDKRNLFTGWCKKEGYQSAKESSGTGLGTDGDFLSVPQGTLEAFENYQYRGIAFCSFEAADRSGQTLQKSRPMPRRSSGRC